MRRVITNLDGRGGRRRAAHHHLSARCSRGGVVVVVVGVGVGGGRLKLRVVTEQKIPPERRR